MTNTRPRLIYVTENIPPFSYCSIGTYVSNLAKLATDAGYAVTIISVNPGDLPEQEVIDGIEHLRFKVNSEGKINYYLSCIKGADKLIRSMQKNNEKMDIIHFFHHIPALGARLTGKLKTLQNKIFTHFGSLSLEYSTLTMGKDRGIGHRIATGMHIEGSIFPLLMDNIEAKNLSKCQKIMTLSSASKQQIISDKVKKNRITALAPGVDLNKFTLGSAEEKKELYGIDGPVYCFVDEFKVINSTDIFVEIAGLLSSVYPKAKFVMIGSGEDEARIRDLFASRLLSDQLMIIPHNEDFPRYLRNVDWLICPALDDQLRLVTFQAMASGVPVALFDVAGNSEYFIHDQSGVMVEPEDHITLVKKLLAFDKHRSVQFPVTLRASMKHYSWDNVFATVDDFYRSLLT